MLNIHQLFTANGLTQAIHGHHKALHEKYNFPPLSGMKPLHKFAENFGYANAEPFLAKLQKLSARMLSTSVNLVHQGRYELVHVGVDVEEQQIRCQIENDSAFLMCTIDLSLVSPAVVTYHDKGNATVWIGAFAITVSMDSQGVTARFFESSGMVDVNLDTEPKTSPEFALVDEQQWLFKQYERVFVMPVIPAKVVSDDGYVNIDFDALDYFESEYENGNIKTVMEALYGCDFSSDYPTDTIAEFFSDSSTERLFDYLIAVDRELNIGYSCTIDQQAAFAWFAKKKLSL